MGNIFNPDFVEFVQYLNKHETKYMLVGGYSVVLYGYPRTTGDMDIWVEKSSENYQRLLQVFADFQMPIFDMTEDNFLHNPEMNVFTFGRPPVAVEILTEISGVTFKEAYPNSNVVQVGELPIRVIDHNDLIKNKKASGRAKDLNDLENI